MDKTNEILYLKKRLNLIFMYLEEKLKSSGAPKEAIDLQISMRKIAEERQKLSDLKAINNEMNSWVQGLSKEDNENLLDIFKKELNEDFSNDFDKKIDEIKIEGIRTDDEFRFINEKVDFLISEDGSKEEINLLNQMLRDYELTPSNKT